MQLTIVLTQIIWTIIICSLEAATAAIRTGLRTCSQGFIPTMHTLLLPAVELYTWWYKFQHNRCILMVSQSLYNNNQHSNVLYCMYSVTDNSNQSVLCPVCEPVAGAVVCRVFLFLALLANLPYRCQVVVKEMRTFPSLSSFALQRRRSQVLIYIMQAATHPLYMLLKQICIYILGTWKIFATSFRFRRVSYFKPQEVRRRGCNQERWHRGL